MSKRIMSISNQAVANEEAEPVPPDSEVRIRKRSGGVGRDRPTERLRLHILPACSKRLSPAT